MKYLPIFLLLPGFLHAAPTSQQLETALGTPILEEGKSLEEFRALIEKKIPEIPDVQDAKEWKEYSEKLRQDILNQVVFRGNYAQNWKDFESKVTYDGTLTPGDGYSIRKLRFEIHPDWWIPALLYVPDNLPDGKKVPVVINVNGHDHRGKAAPYKQARCIHQAKNGMLAMNVEWIGLGQFNNRMGHYHLAQLDLCGVPGIAPFYRNISCALDVALQHPNADPERIAVAGLSGGGWQTIFYSALDTRVKLANPVAGYSSVKTRAHYPSDLGDSEQAPADLGKFADYTHLTALLSDRALLLTKNSKDECCFAAPHALPPLKEAAEPKFKLMGREEYFRTHVNTDPGTHNFDEDNRQQFYKMLGKTFFGDESAIPLEETHTPLEILSASKLEVTLPADNLDINSLALELSKDLPLPNGFTDPFIRQFNLNTAYKELYKILNTKSYSIEAKPGTTKDIQGGYTLTPWSLFAGKEMTLPVIEIAPPGNPAKTVLLISDSGRPDLAKAAAGHLEKGHRILALDPFNFGETNLGKQDFLYLILLSSMGERPLGIQTNQVGAVASWAKKQFGGQPVEFEAHGPRSSLITLVSSIIFPANLSKGTLYQPMNSLKSLITGKVGANQHPELFCYGLLRFVDIPQMMEVANLFTPGRVTVAK